MFEESRQRFARFWFRGLEINNPPTVLGEKHAIGLFEEEASRRKKIARAVTDSGDTPEGEISPGIQNLFELLGACGRESVADGFRNDHQNGTLRYKDLKDAVADAIADATREIKARRLELQKDKEGIMKSVRTMSGKAREIASETVREVRKRIGVPAIL